VTVGSSLPTRHEAAAKKVSLRRGAPAAARPTGAPRICSPPDAAGGSGSRQTCMGCAGARPQIQLARLPVRASSANGKSASLPQLFVGIPPSASSVIRFGECARWLNAVTISHFSASGTVNDRSPNRQSTGTKNARLERRAKPDRRRLTFSTCLPFLVGLLD